MPPFAPSSSAEFVAAPPWSANIHHGTLKRRVKEIPEEPGVYRWLDAKGQVLYVGKAKNLRRRMRSYLGAGAAKEGFRKRGLFEKMADLSITVTNTEIEALVLETHLIRTLRPRYNISLTKDTHYAFIKITVNDDFPSVRVTHHREPDGALYFGPYSSPYAQRRMVEILRGLFHFRDCSMRLGVSRQPSLFPSGNVTKLPLDIVARKKDRRLPCLDYHLEKCCGPCGGMILPEHYRAARIDEVVAFLKGERAAVLGKMIQRLKESPAPRKFERAEELSFVFEYISHSKRRRLFAMPGTVDVDAAAFVVVRRVMHAVILQVRGGNLVNELHVRVGGAADPSSAFSQFLARYYDDVRDVPDTLLLHPSLDDLDLLAAWLSSRRGSPVSVLRPTEGKGLELAELAARNAKRKADLAKTKRKAESAASVDLKK